MPVWCMAPLEMNEGNSMGQGYNRPTGCSAVKALHVTFFFNALKLLCIVYLCKAENMPSHKMHAV